MTDEVFFRLGVFAGVFLILALYERIGPRRSLSTPRPGRWVTNIGISVFDAATVRLIFSAGAYGQALVAAEKGWGLFNQIQLPYWAAVVLSIVMLDFVIYVQHVLFHAVPVFWRFHRVHHTDLDLDVTSGTRFHPVEILLSTCVKIGFIFAFGAPALAVLIFEALLNATSMFEHSNIYIGPSVDGVLRLFVVTPDMHRVHHSVVMKETNSNFGFNLPWWDRLLGTYRAIPERGHLDMVLGLANYRDGGKLGFLSLFIIPFMK